MDAEPAERAAGRSGGARWALTVVFGINGLLIASMAVRTPSVKIDLDLSDGQLGLLSGLFGVAGVLAMQTTGALTARFGSRTIVRIVTAVLPVLLIGIGLAPQYLAMATLQVAFGALYGTLDVSMNVHAVAWERATKRRIMSRCHGAWSIGSISGALLGSGAAHVGMSRTEHYALLCAVLVPAALVAGQFLMPTPAGPTEASGRREQRTGKGQRPGQRPGQRTGRRTGWTRPLLVFGAMGATVLTAEAAVISWSGVFLHDDRRASLGLSGLGYVAFALCQTSLRLVGDRIQARVPAARLLRRGGVAAAAGVGVVVLGPWPWVGIAGFGIMGLALSLCLPVLFGAVGHFGAETGGGDAGAATMLSRFSTMTYTGILVGPALIGWVADHLGLSWTLALLAPPLLAVAAAARAVDLRAPRPARPPASPPPTDTAARAGTLPG